ncbi:hypothetical protein E5Q_05158 [Mixia osmundae IAM 14324]|uniref:Uncharacterized protein n=1 Tax=Mixia osmundae (strain CBS 9802 / IAM 14324 / JCM 22182 / KY 12970) TaxID=764103 RepID=G7E6L2_MIXOS|nr:hypothetical protein E5Q_05158 [Mixia osmundae IAM 14324]
MDVQSDGSPAGDIIRGCCTAKLSVAVTVNVLNNEYPTRADARCHFINAQFSLFAANQSDVLIRHRYYDNAFRVKF